MIPKIIYQTWKTNTFHPTIQTRIDDMKKYYQGYEYQFFLDDDMDDFVNNNFDKDIINCYNSLNIRVAKVDFWRYLILYKHGGIYLDMDSGIHHPLNDLIKDDDDAIITAEGNPNLYVQWALIFKKEHPILKKTIEIVTENIKMNKYPHDIHKMTGPTAFTLAVNEVHKELYNDTINHATICKDTNNIYNKDGVRYRIYGIDYNQYFSCKYPECRTLFKDSVKWKILQKTEPVVKIPNNI